MTNRMIGPVAAFIILVVAQGGLAQVNIPKIYWGAGVGTLNYSEDDEDLGDIDSDLSIYALNVRLGMNFNKSLSAELRGIIGLNKDSDSYRFGSFNIDLTSKVKTIFGLHARLSIPTSSPVTPYVMLGHARTTTSVSADVFSGTFPIAELSGEDSMSKVSYGVGVDVALEVIRLNAEYAKYGKIGALSIGIVRGF